MLMGHGPALFSDLLWVVEWALPVTVCVRAGLESLCSSPRWADKGCFPQGVPGVVELWPHVPFLTFRPTKASVSPDEETAVQEAHSPARGPTE